MLIESEHSMAREASDGSEMEVAFMECLLFLRLNEKQSEG
jgi:hypothetical protein